MPSEQHRKAAILSGMRILVIDDSANARRLLKSLLMAFGVGGDEVIMVGDAPSGLELLHTLIHSAQRESMITPGAHPRTDPL